MLKNLNGTPPEVFANQELLDLVLPVLRADFAVCDSYQYYAEAPLECPITAFAGQADRGVPVEAIAGWSAQTSASFELHEFTGDHFFIRSQEREFLAVLDRVLGELASRVPGGSGATQ
jgi:medium-chain acyl-[acyl-carrier-protein] hydrolase